MKPSAQNDKSRRHCWMAIVMGLLLAACGGGGEGSSTSTSGPVVTPTIPAPAPAPPPSPASSGTLRLALTDAPSCGYDKVNVTIQKIRVHASGSASDSDAGWSEIAPASAVRVDLLTLMNGTLSELGQTALPTGKYTQMRLLLAANGASAPWANSVVVTGGTETALTIPSAVQSGLKMNVDIDVAANQVADFVLDFDACRSVRKLGNAGGFLLQPVITVLPRLSDTGSRVIGYVSADVASTTLVSAQVNGVPIKSTQPDVSGKFTLTPLPTGTYDVVIQAADRATATVTGVPVSATSITSINASTSPISPPATFMRTVSGTVMITPAPTLVDALVVARKAYSDGPTVEVSGRSVDGTSGALTLSLPGGSPRKASYVAGTSTIVFTEDSAAPTGKYTLVLTAGAVIKTLDVDLTMADATGLSFVFP
ncbi:MAG TPA: DUF4382 domain-containing protein [Burkholderiaceae bacterium]